MKKKICGLGVYGFGNLKALIILSLVTGKYFVAKIHVTAKRARGEGGRGGACLAVSEHFPFVLAINAQHTGVGMNPLFG